MPVVQSVTSPAFVSFVACGLEGVTLIVFVQVRTFSVLFNSIFNCLLPKSCLPYRQHPSFQVRLPLRVADPDHRAVQQIMLHVLQVLKQNKLVINICKILTSHSFFAGNELCQFNFILLNDDVEIG